MDDYAHWHNPRRNVCLLRRSAVHAVATTKGIRLFIDIPLKRADHFLELYKVHPLPFFHTGINKHIGALLCRRTGNSLLLFNHRYFRDVLKTFTQYAPPTLY